MASPEKIQKQSDSLIELLTAQCTDLEKLLSLAREETAAAEGGDFDGVLRVVSERAVMSEKLETFQRQIAELRERIGGQDAEAVWQGGLTTKMSEVIRQIITHDTQTHLLLTASRQSSINELNNVEYTYRGSNAYLREMKKGLAYDQCF